MSADGRRRAHRTEWPGQDSHSNERRPIVYRGGQTGLWWVDTSGTDPRSWSDEEWEQPGFETWAEALAYALSSVESAASGPDPRNATRPPDSGAQAA